MSHGCETVEIDIYTAHEVVLGGNDRDPFPGDIVAMLQTFAVDVRKAFLYIYILYGEKGQPDVIRTVLFHLTEYGIGYHVSWQQFVDETISVFAVELRTLSTY